MVPVILSGGSGTRLWPVSRAKYPKQFCEFYNESFMDSTIQRLLPLGPPYILTVKDLQSLTELSAKRFALPGEQLIYEPYGKNTAPAVALLCHILQLQGLGDQVVGIFPADHLVLNQSLFLKAIHFAESCAHDDQIVTIGVPPSRPATGYGYIEIEEKPYHNEKDSSLGVHKVKAFLEKPDVSTAESFLKSGRHYWNAGIFLFKVNFMIKKFQEHLPELWERIFTIKNDLGNIKPVYANLASVSIDYGIMEKVSRQVCIPCDMGWSDVGSWEEMARVGGEVRELKSTSQASIYSVEAKGNYAYTTDSKVVSFVGVNDLIVVDTPDGLLVSKKGKSEGVKEIVHQLSALGQKEANEHFFERRPWGRFDIIQDSENYKLKKIEVLPGQRLSYQSHSQRSEHWIVTMGQALVTMDGVERELSSGDYIFIPRQAKHRVENRGEGVLQFIELQLGDYFGEDDIVRYEDDHGRIK